ncbi:hypothetical protein PQJ75_30450 [Rhodoplanes sp. TEM]|uniref:Uncharacterized protein n=1 Tax=Rhodoplanes tepidamans TaxID=200616 RepID=A0ABT5JEP8_RHOTP|nr:MULTISPECIES: hypothetical protein [Rhodoplanes]MDC7788161.1 hypothetical protein [Rhodoplanes tepidamans]MDC7988071.1 hypothetical protein [Rhodoplanes sp. TEM]MDQ0355149.1 hypothetical protein [Rhodoplanes tepidamans]
MRVVEDRASRLALQSSGFANAVTCILDKPEGTLRVQRKVLLWPRSPIEAPLDAVEDVTVSEVKDPASGTHLHIPVLHLATGQLVSLSSTDEGNATEVVEKIRAFLDIDGDGGDLAVPRR